MLFSTDHSMPKIDFSVSFNQRMQELLRQYSRVSTCPERKVSAAIVGYTSYGYRILSVGVNGDPCHTPHAPLYLHKRLCSHAEEQSIQRLPRDYRRYFIVSFSSLAPCYRCAKKLRKIGTHLHVYLDEYDDNTGVNSLLDEGTPVCQLRHGHLYMIDPNMSSPFPWGQDSQSLWRDVA
jgi:deoxycytidylate deaminase